MRSLPKVIKQSNVVPSDKIAVIPDNTPRPPAWDPPAELFEADGEALAALGAQGQGILAENLRGRADEVSRKILQSARAEREKLLEQARAEAARLREEARREGAREALEEKRAEMERCIAEAEGLLDELQEQQRSFLEQYEAQLKFLALDIAEKVLCQSLGDREEWMAPLVEQAISGIKNADWISVQVSERLPGLVDCLKRGLASLDGKVEITAADLPEDSCIVQTPEGVLDASVSVQLDNLKNIFLKMD